MNSLIRDALIFLIPAGLLGVFAIRRNRKLRQREERVHQLYLRTMRKEERRKRLRAEEKQSSMPNEER